MKQDFSEGGGVGAGGTIQITGKNNYSTFQNRDLHHFLVYSALFPLHIVA